ncbi:MAG: hypothetical protein LBK53_01970 [Heliobacteriaceae bacterium]|nr:hypothetical protein [Heliobacteriaceae bacterium]
MNKSWVEHSVLGAGSACPSPSGRRWRKAPDEGFIDNVIARSLHGKRRSNPVKTVNLLDCRAPVGRSQ